MNLSKLNKFIFFILVLISSSSFSEELIQVKCSLFDLQGNLVYRWPDLGEMCLFLNDGSVIAADFDQMRRIDSKGNIKWSVKGFFHHQMKLSEDQGYVYILGAKTNELFDGKVRMDTVESIDITTGKKVAVLELFNFLRELAVDPSLSLHRGFFQKSLFSYDYDLTHANSIFELPENKLARSNQAFKKGNLLINIGMLRHFIIVDRDMKKLLWKKSWHQDYFDVHDVQLNEKGELVVYINGIDSPSGKVTVVHHIDPMIEYPSAIIKKFIPLINGKTFFQHFVGGVQERSNGDILLSVVSAEKGFELA